MIDEQWYIVANFGIMIFCWKFRNCEVKNEYFDRYQNLFIFQSLLIKGIHLYSFNIYEIFWDGKMVNGVFGLIKKTQYKK